MLYGTYNFYLFVYRRDKIGIDSWQDLARTYKILQDLGNMFNLRRMLKKFLLNKNDLIKSFYFLRFYGFLLFY